MKRRKCDLCVCEDEISEKKIYEIISVDFHQKLVNWNFKEKSCKNFNNM